MTVDKKELGHCLKDARKSAGFTQEKLAEKVGMSPAAISKIERGLTLPSLDNFIGIVNALGISADEILDQVNHKTYRLKLSFLTERFYRLQHQGSDENPEGGGISRRQPLNSSCGQPRFDGG